MMLMAGGSLKWSWGGYTGGYCLTVTSFLLDPPTGEPCHLMKKTVIQFSCGNKCNNYWYYDILVIDSSKF